MFLQFTGKKERRDSGLQNKDNISKVLYLSSCLCKVQCGCPLTVRGVRPEVLVELRFSRHFTDITSVLGSDFKLLVVKSKCLQLTHGCP